MKLYDHFCKKCNETTIHQVSRISRKRGIKLQCLKCFGETTYLNLNKLSEHSIEPKGGKL